MFLSYLPQDNVGLDKDADEALEAINDDLASLLRSDAKSFWQIVRADSSLHACLSSYLQFARSGTCFPDSNGSQLFCTSDSQLVKMALKPCFSQVCLASV